MGYPLVPQDGIYLSLRMARHGLDRGHPVARVRPGCLPGLDRRSPGWTSSQVTSAWQLWGRLIATPNAVNGGSHSALITNYGDAAAPMFETPPGRLMDHQASFITSQYAVHTADDGSPVRAGRDFDMFPFPSINDRYADSLEIGADMAGTFTGTPEAKALLDYLAHPQQLDALLHNLDLIRQRAYGLVSK